MIAWIVAKTGISAIVVKLILCAAALGAVLFALRLYGNRQWYKGQAAGRVYEAKAIEQAKQSEWKIKAAAIAADATKVDAEKAAIKAAADQLAKDRLSIGMDLKTALATQTARKERDYANTASVAPDQLDSAIRTISAELAAAHP